MSDFVWPPSPATDEQVTGPYGEVYEFDGVKWSLVPGGTGGGGGASVTVGATPPASPNTGSLWWSTVTVKLYMWDGGQWAVVSNVPEGSGGGAAPPGVTDGSTAATGQVGELIPFTSVINSGLVNGANPAIVVSYQIPPGDWQLSGSYVAVGFGITGFTGGNAAISASTPPSGASMGTSSNPYMLVASGSTQAQASGSFTGYLNTAVTQQVDIYFSFNVAPAPILNNLDISMWAWRRR